LISYPLANISCSCKLEVRTLKRVDLFMASLPPTPRLIACLLMVQSVKSSVSMANQVQKLRLLQMQIKEKLTALLYQKMITRIQRRVQKEVRSSVAKIMTKPQKISLRNKKTTLEAKTILEVTTKESKEKTHKVTRVPYLKAKVLVLSGIS